MAVDRSALPCTRKSPKLRARAVGGSRGDDGRNLLQVLFRRRPPPRQECRRELPFSCFPVSYLSCPSVLYSYLLPSLLAQRRDLPVDTICKGYVVLALRGPGSFRFELFRLISYSSHDEWMVRSPTHGSSSPFLILFFKLGFL